MLRTLFISSLILGSVQGSPISSDGLKKPQSTDILRDAKSKAILKYMNESADPCELFFDFACGNWKTHHPATENYPRTRSLDVALEDFYEKVDQLLITENETDTEAEIKVKHFYESCLSFTSLKSAEYKDKLLGIIKEFGQMPALEGDEWQEEDFDWLKTVAEISYKYGFNIILGYTIDSASRDHTANNMILTCEKANTFGEDEDDISTELNAFLDLEQEMALAMAKEIVEFGTILGDVKDRDDELSSVQDVYKKYLPDLDVRKLFNISYGSGLTGEICDNCNVEALLEAVENTPKRVVANYIFYQLLTPFMLRYPENKTELEKKCRSTTLKYFPQIVSFMLYRSNDLKERETDLEIIWQDMKSTLQIMLESSKLNWFDDTAREYALEKLHSMQMVAPLYKENNFDEQYRQLTFNRNDYLENLKSLKTFNAVKTRASLDASPQYTDDGLELYTPVYMFQSNTLIIPVSVLATEFFWSTSYPKAINFADVGFSLGHEAIHGFSAGGRMYNKLGNYMGDWSEVVETEYEERRQCLYDQYHNYTFGGQHLPQDETQSENAADVGGILLAYETYRRWYEDSARTKEELAQETFPQLNYTNKQLFFINYAQVWCADTYEGERSNTASSDEHSPDEFRTFVPLTNIGEFSKAFKCPKGSAMNPVKQCSIY